VYGRRVGKGNRLADGVSGWGGLTSARSQLALIEKGAQLAAIAVIAMCAILALTAPLCRQPADFRPVSGVGHERPEGGQYGAGGPETERRTGEDRRPAAAGSTP
jgi:hypothetical protein